MPYSRGLKSSSFSAWTREQSCSQHTGTCTGIKATIAQNAAFCQKKACWEPRWEAETWICRSEKLETYFQQPEMNRFPWKMTSFTTPAKLKWELFVSPLYFPPISSSPVWWRCQIQTAPQSTEQKDENQPHTHQPTAGQGWMPHSSWLQAPGLSLDVAARMYCTWKAWDSRKQMGCNAKATSPREFGTNFHI